MAIDGQKDRLISVVQQRYGYPLERARQEVDQRLQEYGERAAGVAATVTSTAQCGLQRGRDGWYGGHESPGDGGGGSDHGNRHGGRGRHLLTGERRTGPPGRPRGLIRRYPIPAVLIGLGIGLWLGRTLGKATTADGA